MKKVLLHKGMKIRVDFNYYKFGDGMPDIQECVIVGDGPPRYLHECRFLLVGRKKNEFYTVGVKAFVHEKMQLRLF